MQFQWQGWESCNQRASHKAKKRDRSNREARVSGSSVMTALREFIEDGGGERWLRRT
jgi:hypothetical protein